MRNASRQLFRSLPPDCKSGPATWAPPHISRRQDGLNLLHLLFTKIARQRLEHVLWHHLEHVLDLCVAVLIRERIDFVYLREDAQELPKVSIVRPEKTRMLLEHQVYQRLVHLLAF